MPNKWYAEAKNFAGEWIPSVYYQDEKPTGKYSEGGKRELNNVHRITGNLAGLNICELYAHFNGGGVVEGSAKEGSSADR